MAEDFTFKVASPTRFLGRPKQTSKSKKASRRKHVEMVQVDSDLYSSGLRLSIVSKAVEKPTHLREVGIYSFQVRAVRVQQNSQSSNCPQDSKVAFRKNSPCPIDHSDVPEAVY
ncbi:hypothetical protein L915_10137 [Phytophthora nicotianae]|uniref:Uncharacterized protein n=1 Tax=Phytophthora nicotianae TaxID=4792 RepID=W2GRQ1_PHYNI|nr:hypothetical protein L915_10137 [Phytophthora nicotianae]